MYRLKKIAELTVICLALPWSISEASADICKIYYLPLNVGTYLPVSKKEIEDQCKHSPGLCFRLKQTRSIQELFSGVSDESKRQGKPYDFINVRVKLVCENFHFPIYIDSGKGIHTDDYDYLVDPKLVSKVVNEIEGAAKTCQKELTKAGKKRKKMVPCYLEE